MSNHFPPDEDDEMPAKKNSQQLLLLLLLLLVALFAYLYFFTGVIRPREGEPQPQAQQAPEKLVKQPLPPRVEQPATPAAATPVQEAKQAQPAAPPAKPAASAPAAKPAAPPAAAAKPATPPAAVAKPAKPAPTVPAAKSAKPAPTAAPARQAKPAKPATEARELKPAAAAGKKGAADRKAAATSATNGAQKRAAAEKTEAATSKKGAAAKPAAPAYVLEINGDLLESETAGVTAKLKRAGISHVVKSKAQKGETMHRLFLADFGNREEALDELERLKLAAPNAFMLKEGGRYAVYGGSYLHEEKASAEQNRLYGKGVNLQVKSATVPVSVVTLRAGSFADQASAGKAASKLKKAGLSAKVVKVDK